MSISVNNVSFSYDGKRPVLTGASFQADRGAIAAVVGPSGSGKSTLLRLIAGLLPRSQTTHCMTGQILLNSSSPNLATLPRGVVSLMFQEPVLLPNRTVEQNIALPLEMLKATEAIIADRVEDALREIGLTAFRTLRPFQLSVGMKTRVSLAMTIITRPSFLLLDEPFSSLDLGWRLALYRTLTSVHRSGGPTIVLVTHDLHEAVLLADMVFVLGSDGRLLEPVPVGLPKPSAFTSEELSVYNTQSINIYSRLERLVLAATVFENSAEERLLQV